MKIVEILLVENHENFAQQVVASFLTEYKVQTVATVADALKELKRHEYEFVLIDYDLDDGKGTEVCHEICSHSPRPHVIAISSHDAGNRALLGAGADAVCPKLDFAKINDVIQGLTPR